MNTPYVFKRCSKCGEILPATTEYFYKRKCGKYGLRAECKKCNKEHQKEWRTNNKEYIKQYREVNKEAIKERRKQYYETNKEREAERRKQYYETNKEREAESHRQYYEVNKEIIKDYIKQYYEVNKEARKKYAREYGKQYHKTPKGQVVAFNGSVKRRTKEQNQGNGITTDQWKEMMSFFEFRCAYSGKYIGGNSKDRTIDHIDSLNKGGEHEIWNVVPMDKGLNSSKKDKDMLQWYKEQTFFSKERLNKIYEWQEYAYKKWHDKEEII